MLGLAMKAGKVSSGEFATEQAVNLRFCRGSDRTR